ncbi:DUF6907 domain-containing protein [Compostimonas suwonensis]|uniref:Uncharacterized protein n=1 Tax=Compostimonas suwonensis TaxID=1048394 RepID=A0A2M9BVF4_9MICO|nr:hypothetical protein [Compostimonas suwonensis]PJJ61923.1 hypothetical protein CLV54_1711 [Compostimonas suwonensis]
MTRYRPAWQQTPCPPWCVQEHADADPPADRRHVGSGHPVPVVLAPGGRAVATSAELSMIVWRFDGSPETWVYLGDGTGQRIEVSLESARRLFAQLPGQLGRVVP